MKRVIRAAKYGPYNYRYEVYAVSPNTHRHILRGTSATVEGANEICQNQAEMIFSDAAFNGPEYAFEELKSMYIYDTETRRKDLMSLETEDYIDGLMSELDGKIQRKQIPTDDYLNDKW